MFQIDAFQNDSFQVEIVARRRSRSQFEEPAISVQIREEDEEILGIINTFLFVKGV
jgi:hypothetical protein